METQSILAAISLDRHTTTVDILKGLFTNATFYVAIDILEYVFNWRQRRRLTTANHKQISCCLDCHEFVTNTRMIITTCDFVPCNWRLGVCVWLTRASRTNYSESFADILLQRLSCVYYIHQDDNRNVQNRTCKQPLKLICKVFNDLQEFNLFLSETSPPWRVKWSNVSQSNTKMSGMDRRGSINLLLNLSCLGRLSLTSQIVWCKLELSGVSQSKIKKSGS